MKIIYLLFIFVSSAALAQESFVNPLKIPMYMSGSFAELRANHFHSGVDIKTQEEIGFPVFAIQDGWVSRIKVSPWGYGNAIYIDHPSGYTSVYAHLSKFNDEISNYILNEQYKNKSFYIDKYFKKDEVKIQQSDVIAFSGNSGGSGGPHLHFELREQATQKPINPLQFNFDIKDTISPEFKSLVLYLDDEKHFFNAELQDDGVYVIEDTILIHDNFELGIITRDESNNSSNPLGINKINYFVGNDLFYAFKNEKFSFSESRYVNSHIDYKEYALSKKRIQKLFVDPGNKLSLYQVFGKYKQISCDSIINGKVEIFDSKNNKSVLRFVLKRECIISEERSKPEGVLFRYNEKNTFKNENIEIELPEKALYSDFYFQYKEFIDENFIGDIVYSVHNSTVPLHKNMKLTMKAPPVKGYLRNKLLIVRKNGKSISALKTKLQNGTLSVKTREFGDYTFALDTTAPIVKIKRINTEEPSKMFVVEIHDNLSGISTYNGYVDGKWILFKYDYKNKQIYYDLDEWLKKEEKERKLMIKISDSVGNITMQEQMFFY